MKRVLLAILSLPFIGALAYGSYQGLVYLGSSVASPLYAQLVANSGAVSTSNPNPTMTAGTFTYAFSQSTNGDVTLGSSAIIDAQLNGDLSEVDVKIDSVGTGGILTFYGSNDQTTWKTLSEQREDGIWTYNAGVFYAGNQFTIPLHYRYFKMTVSGISAGSLAGSVTFKTKYAPFPAGAFPTNPAYSWLMAFGSSFVTPAFVTTSDASVVVSTAAAATGQLVGLVAGKSIYVTDIEVQSAGTTNVSFVYGTGTNCGTGTTSLTGAVPLTTGGKISHGHGLGAIFTIPAGNALCMVNSAAIQVSGWVSYAQR